MNAGSGIGRALLLAGVARATRARLRVLDHRRRGSGRVLREERGREFDRRIHAGHLRGCALIGDWREMDDAVWLQAFGRAMRDEQNRDFAFEARDGGGEVVRNLLVEPVCRSVDHEHTVST